MRYTIKLRLPVQENGDALSLTVYDEGAAIYLYEALERAGEEVELSTEKAEVLRYSRENA